MTPNPLPPTADRRGLRTGWGADWVRHTCRTKPARGVLQGLGCALVVWLLTRTSILQTLEDGTLDARFALRGTRPTQARVLLIGVDEASYDELKKPAAHLSPELAKVVKYVHGRGARAIGVDLLLKTSENDGDPGGAGDPSTLGRVVVEAGNVVLPRYWVNRAWVWPPLQWRIKSQLNPEPTDIAFVNFTDDRPSVRRQQLLIRDGEEMVPQFALALYARAQGAAIDWDDDRAELKVGGDPIPLDSEQMLRINFVGPAGTFPTTPFRDVLRKAREGPPLPGIEDAIVLIGDTTPDQQDYHRIPFAGGPLARGTGLMSGMEIHAHILATLVDRAFLTTPGWLSPLAVLPTLGGLLGLLFAFARPKRGIAIALGFSVAWAALCFLTFVYCNWQVELTPVPLLASFTYATAFAGVFRKPHRREAPPLQKIRILFLSANPASTTPLRLDEEVREITNKIGASRYRDSFELVTQWAVRPDDLLQCLNQHRPHIVHFSGHGSTAEEIVLLDDARCPAPVSTKALASLFRVLKGNVRVVLLNACYSRSQAEEITQHVDCAIGMNRAIGDEAAIKFAASFYRAVGFGNSILDAFGQGQASLLLHGIAEDQTPELLARKGVRPSEIVLVSPPDSAPDGGSS